MKVNKAGTWVVAMALAVSGCSYATRKVPNIPFGNCSVQVQEEDFYLGIEPFDTRDETIPVFGEELSRRGFLPFYLTFTNNHPTNEQALYTHGNCTFADRSGASWVEVEGRELTEEYGENPWAARIFYGVMYGGIAGIVAGETAKDDNARMTQDFDKTIMDSQHRVLPGATERGFVIFREPKQRGASSDKFRQKIQGGALHLKIYRGRDRGVEERKIILK